jgi:uncharacterized protein YbjT (DUF2867 family)
MKVLLTGSTGYIGRRLMKVLLDDNNISLRLLVRNAGKAGTMASSRIEISTGDTLHPETLRSALTGIDTAIYLIHSMGAGNDDFENLDRTSAINFRDACVEAGVSRIIYLGGLGVSESASKHLRSRLETGALLSDVPPSMQTIWFRAGIIIGSGGASFEIIHNLVEKLPLMITPRWVSTMTQAVAIDDVLRYLHRALYLDCRKNLVVDIGSDKLSFREMLSRAATVLGLKRYIVRVPFFSPRLSSYWLVFFTTVPFRIASALIDGLKSETIALNDNAAVYFPEIVPVSYMEAFKNAIAEIENKQILSRWCDSSGGKACDISGEDLTADDTLLYSCTSAAAGVSASDIFAALIAIGGRNGWFTYGILWIFRGGIDKLFGGYGLNRGRRSDTELRVGDALDFWKVADIVFNRRLLLQAQMKLPGKAWLEFLVDHGMLKQTAYFIPRGIGGRLYWYLLYPLHVLIFRDMVKRIVRRAKKM